MAQRMSATQFDEYVLIVVSQDDRPQGYQVLNLSADYGPLIKELAYRALARDGRLAGRSCRIHARTGCGGRGRPELIVEAHVQDGSRRTGEPIASLAMPVEYLAWLASRIAAQVGVEGAYRFQVMVLGANHPLIERWEAGMDLGSDFAVTSGPTGCLTLPSLLVRAEPTEIVGGPGSTWLKCLFSRKVYDEFRLAARAERERERSWAGLGEIQLCPDCCFVTIKELRPLPGEAGREWIRTRGRDFAALCHEFGDRLTAYLHLHPRSVDGQRIAPSPSGNDATLAWDYSAAVAAPCVFPIALFGDESQEFATDMAVYGYDKGVLTPIRWEVLRE